MTTKVPKQETQNQFDDVVHLIEEFRKSYNDNPTPQKEKIIWDVLEHLLHTIVDFDENLNAIVMK